MSRAVKQVLRVSAVLTAVAIAACDTMPTAVQRPAPANAASQMGSPGTMTTYSVPIDPDGTCRSGYHIAYREDGTAYCEVNP